MAKAIANPAFYLVFVADFFESQVPEWLHQRHPPALLMAVAVELHIPDGRVHHAAARFVHLNQEKQQRGGALGLVHLHVDSVLMTTGCKREQLAPTLMIWSWLAMSAASNILATSMLDLTLWCLHIQA